MDRWHTPGEFVEDESAKRAEMEAEDVGEDKHKTKYKSFVRAVVNGKQERMSGCEDGIGHSCAWDTFSGWVQQRSERWGDWESVCDKDKKD